MLVKSTDVHVLCLGWLRPAAGHSFHGARSQRRVCFKKWELCLVRLSLSLALSCFCYGFLHPCDQPVPSKSEGQAGIFS